MPASRAASAGRAVLRGSAPALGRRFVSQIARTVADASGSAALDGVPGGARECAGAPDTTPHACVGPPMKTPRFPLLALVAGVLSLAPAPAGGEVSDRLPRL